MSSIGMLARKTIRRPVVWVRHRDIGPQDVLIASYPRSGCTWLRFLLFEALTNQPAGFVSVNRHIPGPGSRRAAAALLPNDGRLVQSHDPSWPRGTRVVYLVRDVRDVVLSSYRAHIRRGVFEGSLDDYIGPFLMGDWYFGSWARHVDYWIGSDDDPSRRGVGLTLTYEELRRDPNASLASVVRFLGVEREESVISRAVANNAIDAMRAKEDAAPPGTIDYAVQGIRFVGKGKAGGWKDELSDDQLERIESSAGAQLLRLGYRLGR
jgi:hypothetical protein